MERTSLIRRESAVIPGRADEQRPLLTVSTSQNAERPFPSHLLFSVLSILFCPPLGIMAVIEALKVAKATRLNNQEAGQKSSALAAEYSLAGVIIGTHLGALLGTCAIIYLYQI